MADELGMAFDTVRDVASAALDIFNALETVRDICDGTVTALSVVSAIPGAAAVTGPVIGTYTGIRPTLSMVIDTGDAACEYLVMAIQAMDAMDELIEGEMGKFADEAASLAAKAMND